ncbi:MAG: hypothetical protein MK364_06325, partial [Pirellulales bacterium]|nr:hypothetical protein [Pirellulales bacterium]
MEPPETPRRILTYRLSIHNTRCPTPALIDATGRGIQDAASTPSSAIARKHDSPLTGQRRRGTYPAAFFFFPLSVKQLEPNRAFS